MVCSPVGRLGDSSFSRRFNWRNAPDGHMRCASTEEVQRSVSPRRQNKGKLNEQDVADSVTV